MDVDCSPMKPIKAKVKSTDVANLPIKRLKDEAKSINVTMSQNGGISIWIVHSLSKIVHCPSLLYIPKKLKVHDNCCILTYPLLFV